MTPKRLLLTLTAIAVVSDSVLHPFYPRYLEQVFAVKDPRTVGFYIATCSVTVLLTFPLWALLARRIPVLRLLTLTQFGAAALSMLCYAAPSITWFWLATVALMATKASYLLIYPYVMTLETKEQHIGTISLLAFVVYFGNILAAALGGAILEWLPARALFAVMAAGDVALALLCARHQVAASVNPTSPETNAVPSVAKHRPGQRIALKLGIVMAVLYFSAYLSEPFFANYWHSIVRTESDLLAGLAFAVPGVAALFGLWMNRCENSAPAATPYAGIVTAILVAASALAMQVAGNAVAVIAARFFYGIALFHAMVRLDAIVFHHSSPESYAEDFSLASMFQGVGVLIASLTAGGLVARFGLTSCFAAGAVGFGVALTLICWWFRKEIWSGAELEARTGNGTGVKA